METCQFLRGCSICEKLKSLSPETREKYVRRYCKGDYDSCARYLVATALGRDAVPAAMLPSETDRALRLIGSRRSAQARPEAVAGVPPAPNDTP